MSKRKFYIIFFLIGFIMMCKIRYLNRRIKRLRASKRLKKYIDIARRTEDKLELSAAYYTIANIYLFDFNDPESAEDYYRKVIDCTEKNYLEDSALFNLGLCIKKTSPSKAEKIFRQLIKEYPDSARARDAESELSRI